MTKGLDPEKMRKCGDEGECSGLRGRCPPIAWILDASATLLSGPRTAGYHQVTRGTPKTVKTEQVGTSLY